MKKVFLFVAFLCLLLNTSLSGQTGEEIFKSVCAACHSIGKGRLVGPDLSGVYKTKNNDWLISFIRSSQKMVKAGDKDAVAIFNEYNKIPMPDNNYSDEQILSIIDFIKKSDGAPAETGAKPPAGDTTKSVATTDTTKNTETADTLTAQQPSDSLNVANQQPAASTDTLLFTEETTTQGRSLFNGSTRFTNLGTPCISCHNVNDQSILGGGKLAIDLTFSYSKLGPAGINAILANPPFPVMKAAVMNNPLSHEEITALVSFLKSVDEYNKEYTGVHPGAVILVLICIVCALFLYVHLYVFYDNRKITDPFK